MEEEFYYPSSENKGADQLRGYREADLRLCFRLCRLFVFPRGGLSIGKVTYSADISLRLNQPGFKAISDASALEKRNENKWLILSRCNKMLGGKCTANRRLCFRYTGGSISPLLNSGIQSF